MAKIWKGNTRRKTYRDYNATRIVALSFGGLILLGTALLLLPVMSRSGRSAGLFCSLFTATSATCVTGFTLRETLAQWTFGGQLVLLCLIQLGGLGFMVVYSLLLTLFHRELLLSQRMVLASALGLKNVGGVVRLVRHALVLTAVCEAAGTLLLAVRFVPMFGFWTGLWRSLFHSVSAFCNAGFDLFSGGGSLMVFSDDPYVLGIHMALTVIGGLGFFVWEDLWQNRRWSRLSLYSRLALGATLGFLLAGGFYFLLAEWGNPGTLGRLSPGMKALDALFQSANLRTAGFVVFPQGNLTEPAKVMCLLFMLVGGCSGSTACGIKTVTAVVLAAALVSGLRGREETVLFGRTVPREAVRRAMVLTLTLLGVIFLSSMAIAHIEGGSYLPILFETVAAVGTVGMSTGLTPDMTFASHCILLALMYVGRVGILSFSLAFLVGRGNREKIRYPACEIMIG